MINYKELNRIGEELRTTTNDMVSWALVDVYEKPKEFYETPRHIISASIPSRYIQRYKACFSNDYIVTVNKSICVNVSDYLS